jgi:hypothetical protein
MQAKGTLFHFYIALMLKDLAVMPLPHCFIRPIDHICHRQTSDFSATLK